MTIVGAIFSCVSTMNTTIAMIRLGAAARTTRPVVVSPISLWATPAAMPASAAPTTKINTAATTLGR